MNLINKNPLKHWKKLSKYFAIRTLARNVKNRFKGKINFSDTALFKILLALYIKVQDENNETEGSIISIVDKTN